ncbi:hypothetical protein FO519_003773 [Halicephalobus sp. NKZ332]|nr:hypothetical protein FO519_003773 [Halicephalobus sp. NKZ332]
MKAYFLFLIFNFIIQYGSASVCFGEFISKPVSYTTVETSRGSVTGARVDFGNDRTQMYYGSGDVFHGIPYATPPIGEHRWKKPVRLDKFPASPWNATFDRPACPQHDLDGTSEDCLYLNIYTPDAKSKTKYPVMVWIHGGALITGALRNYEPEGIIRNFVSRGVVVVSIQYRVGMLGFFTTFTEEFPPNRGMLDQVEALNFIKEEVSNFGGNPYKITLFGQSAGSASVAAHTYSPLSQNLFQQAIMQSASVMTCFDGSLGFQNTSVQRAETLCNFTRDDWNTRNYTRLWNCLADMSYTKFVDLDKALIMGWQMVQDNYFLPDVPRNLAAKRPNIPVIYGSCKDEWAFYEFGFIQDGLFNFTSFNKESFEFMFQLLGSYFTSRRVDVQGILENVYSPIETSDDDNLAWFKTQDDAFTSAGFTGFISKEISWYLSNGNDKVYTYEFTYPSDINRNVIIPGFKPVYHSEEMLFVFMQSHIWKPAAQKGQITENDYFLADFFADAWTNFAKYSQPTLDDSWPVTDSSMNYLDINPNPIVKRNYRQIDDYLWNGVLPPLVGNWPPERPDYDNGTNAFEFDWSKTESLLSRYMKAYFLFLIFNSIIQYGSASVCFGEFISKAVSYTTVETSRGSVTGVHVDFGNDRTQMYYGAGDVFRGIPYATPPTGEHRWKKPVGLDKFPASPWNATFDRPACPQHDLDETSEDCLYLNIYTPDAKAKNKYPVMIWIHGGSLTTGTIRDYEPEGILRNFVSKGVIVVSIQYRLGMLGFFTTFTEEFPPNRGMLDQVEALNFIKKEISNFGGNPYKITLFGQSAGSASVSAHTLSPLSQNLFHQAIMESGSILTCFDGSLGFQNISVHRAETLCNFTQDDWNTRNYTRLWDCLANMDYSNFLSDDKLLVMGWNMVQDNNFLPDIPRNLAAKRPNIPVIYGSCHDEWSLFELEFIKDGLLKFTDYNKDSFELFFQILASFLASREEDIQGIIENVYLPIETDDNDNLGWFKMQNDAFTSVGFTGFIGREINWYLSNGNRKVYTYELTYATELGRSVVIPGFKPVYHSEDLHFVFMGPSVWKPAIQKGLVTEDDYFLADFFSDAWTNFAKYSQPTLDDSWPVTDSSMNYLDINPKPIMRKNYRQVDNYLWDKVLPPLIGNWPPERPDYDNGTNAFEFDWSRTESLLSRLLHR